MGCGFEFVLRRKSIFNRLAFPSRTPFQGYSSLVLNSIVQSPGGTYTWTSSNPAAFSVAGLSQGRGLLGRERVNVNAPGKATLKLAYRLDCGLYGEDTLDLVLTKDITVFGWINPDAITLPTGANPDLVDDLNTLRDAWRLCWRGVTPERRTAACRHHPQDSTRSFTLPADVDRRYAEDAFLVKRSGNSDPGSNITRWAIEAKFDVGGQGKFLHPRAYNRFQAFFVVRGGRIQPNISKLQDRGRCPDTLQIPACPARHNCCDPNSAIGPGTRTRSAQWNHGI
jgi:hypothetical protein